MLRCYFVKEFSMSLCLSLSFCRPWKNAWRWNSRWFQRHPARWQSQVATFSHYRLQHLGNVHLRICLWSFRQQQHMPIQRLLWTSFASTSSRKRILFAREQFLSESLHSDAGSEPSLWPRQWILTPTSRSYLIMFFSVGFSRGNVSDAQKFPCIKYVRFDEIFIFKKAQFTSCTK